MSRLQAKILNQDSLNSFIEGLKDFEKDKAIRTGLKKGGQVLSKGGQRRLKQSMIRPKGVTGNLLKSFHVKVKRSKLGVLIGFKNRLGNHSHLLDRGTAIRKTIKGYNRGRVPSGRTKFMLGFWFDTKSEDMDKSIIEVYKGITQAVNRIKNRVR